MRIKHIFNGRIFKIFSEKYIKENLELRRGECNKCGSCCKKFIFGLGCPLLINNKCIINKIKPRICRLSPIDEISLKENHPRSCGYYFVDK